MIHTPPGACPEPGPEYLASARYIDSGTESIRRFAEEGKPEKMLDKIVEGRVEKYKDEVCLLRQTYIRDESLTIEKLILQNVAAIGESVIVRRFQRWELGESAASN